MRIAVIIPFRGDPALLSWTLEGYALQQLAPGDTLEVYVGVDGDNMPAIEGRGAVCRNFPRLGAAAVRNALVQETSPDTELLIFGNADARPEPDMVRRHAQAIAHTPPGSMVLGAAPWEMPPRPTIWDLLLDHTPMVFFYHQLQPGAWYDFRQAWTLNLSVRRADFLACGGFHEQLRPVYYEDLALAYRLMGHDKKGVLYEPRARVLHRHPLTLDQYLDREELLGLMAPVLARQCGAAFGLLHGTHDLETLSRSFRHWVKMDGAMHRWIYQRMREWTTVPAETLCTGDARQPLLLNIYQMHIPLKRLAFRLGFLKGLMLAEDSHWQERKSDSLWRDVVQYP